MNSPPSGYRVMETDDCVEGIDPMRFLTGWEARRKVKQMNDSRAMPSYRWKVERKGFLRWEARPYQNILIHR